MRASVIRRAAQHLCRTALLPRRAHKRHAMDARNRLVTTDTNCQHHVPAPDVWFVGGHGLRTDRVRQRAAVPSTLPGIDTPRWFLLLSCVLAMLLCVWLRSLRHISSCYSSSYRRLLYAGVTRTGSCHTSRFTAWRWSTPPCCASCILNDALPPCRTFMALTRVLP
ncbi:hypothetical protein TNCT_161371 [Trichonephila clavata]|uniref:Uncharacterized protein n=1 Tax=Trichonephila clavata TaxID=2740835 RepID=A0A8X6LBU0_TRICU|nr:hypothetical protein TNCT_161371 [Trichonephila clavata]